MLEHAKDLQTRLDLANAQLAILPSPENDLEDTYEVVRHTCKEFIALIERIEALMGKVDANQEGWSECMDYLNIANAKITELEAKIARLENERDAILEAVTQICPAFEIQSITAKVLAARAATPATGAEQVHAPKTIVPEPDQRRIETERIPKKGGE